MSDELHLTHVDLLAHRLDFRGTSPFTGNADLRTTSNLDNGTASLHPAGRPAPSADNDANHAAQPPPKSPTR